MSYSSIIAMEGKKEASVKNYNAVC